MLGPGDRVAKTVSSAAPGPIHRRTKPAAERTAANPTQFVKPGARQISPCCGPERPQAVPSSVKENFTPDLMYRQRRTPAAIGVTNLPSLRPVGVLGRFVDADVALRACTRSALEDSSRLQYEARAATRTAKSERKHAADAQQEEAESGCPQQMVVPRCLPPIGHHADRNEAGSEKCVPSAQSVPDRHRASLRC